MARNICKVHIETSPKSFKPEIGNCQIFHLVDGWGGSKPGLRNGLAQIKNNTIPCSKCLKIQNWNSECLKSGLVHISYYELCSVHFGPNCPKTEPTKIQILDIYILYIFDFCLQGAMHVPIPVFETGNIAGV